MFCNKCGASIEDGSSFCSACGTPLVPEGKASAQEVASEPVEGVSAEQQVQVGESVTHTSTGQAVGSASSTKSAEEPPMEWTGASSSSDTNVKKFGDYNAFAVISLACGVCAWFIPYLNNILAIAALVLGIMANNQIKANAQGAGKGKWMAIVGIVLAIIYIAMIVLVLAACGAMVGTLAAYSSY